MLLGVLTLNKEILPYNNYYIILLFRGVIMCIIENFINDFKLKNENYLLNSSFYLTSLFNKNDRIFVDLESVQKENLVCDKITNILSKEGYFVSDYIGGYCYKKENPKNVLKIGKILKKLNFQYSLLEFSQDPIRNKKINQLNSFVLSKNLKDIVSMSTNRNWKSCMHVVNGSNRESIKEDVKYGSLIIYGINKEDKTIESPFFRVVLKPASNGSFFIDNYYGDVPFYIKKEVDSFVHSVVNKEVEPDELIDESIYSDLHKKSIDNWEEFWEQKNIDIFNSYENKDIAYACIEFLEKAFTDAKDFFDDPYEGYTALYDVLLYEIKETENYDLFFEEFKQHMLTDFLYCFLGDLDDDSFFEEKNVNYFLIKKINKNYLTRMKLSSNKQITALRKINPEKLLYESNLDKLNLNR